MRHVRYAARMFAKNPAVTFVMILSLALGVVAGVLGALGLTRTMESFLVGITATGPITFTGAALLLTFIALLASYLPARRATRVDPVIALPYE